MSAIILDADQKSALAAIRSLVREKIQIHAGASRGTAMGLHSRYATNTFIYTDTKINRAAFIISIKALARRLRDEAGSPPVLYCFSDATHLTVA